MRSLLLLNLVVVVLVGTAGIILILDFLADSGKLISGEVREELPADIERLEDSSLLILTLGDEELLELVVELENLLVLSSESLLTDDGLHGNSVLTHSIESIHLVGNTGVVASGHLITDSVLHETGQGRQHIDWRVDVLLVHVLIDVDLTLGNVTSKIGDRMSDIIVGHGKDGNLSDRTIPALDSTGSLIDSRQIGVHVTGITSSTGHFLSGRRDLSEGVSIRGHISENGKNVHLFLIGKMLSGREGKSRSNNTLNGGIVGVVHEKAHTVHGAVDLEVLLEETSSLKVDTHSGEDNSEVLLVMIVDILSLDKGGLTTDLSTNLGVRKTGSREERNLLASSNRGHSVDSGDTRLDHLSGILSHVRVDRLTLKGEEFKVSVIVNKHFVWVCARNKALLYKEALPPFCKKNENNGSASIKLCVSSLDPVKWLLAEFNYNRYQDIFATPKMRDKFIDIHSQST